MKRKSDNRRVALYVSLRKEKEDEPLYPLDEVIHHCIHRRIDESGRQPCSSRIDLE